MWRGPIVAYMTSCAERRAVRARTIENLAESDWGHSPVVVLDPARQEIPKLRALDVGHLLLECALDAPGDVILFLEDDIEFNRSFRANLEAWTPLVERPVGAHFYGSLYNPDVGALPGGRGSDTFFVADPELVYGSQALVIAVATVEYLLEHWEEADGLPDIRMSRLAARVTPIHYHRPSLVQHLAVASLWGGVAHEAIDFDAEWRAPGVPAHALPAAPADP